MRHRRRVLLPVALVILAVAAGASAFVVPQVPVAQAVVKIASCYGGPIDFAGVGAVVAGEEAEPRTWRIAWQNAVNRLIYEEGERTLENRHAFWQQVSIPVRLGVINHIVANVSVLEPDGRWRLLAQDGQGCYDG